MNITVKASIIIQAPREKVWDYTQDWTRRTEWDSAIVSARIVEQDPRVVSVVAQGGLESTVRYKLYDRPNRTSLHMSDFSSSLFTSGGGSWEYVDTAGGTEFRQTNTLAMKGLFAFLLAPIVRWQLGRATRTALARAKAILESQPRK